MNDGLKQEYIFPMGLVQKYQQSVQGMSGNSDGLFAKVQSAMNQTGVNAY